MDTGSGRMKADNRSLRLTPRTKPKLGIVFISLNIIICACGIATIVITIAHRSSVAGEEHVLVFSRLPTAHGQSADEAVRTLSLLDRGPFYLSGVGAIALILGLYGVVIVILRHSVIYLCSYSVSMGILILTQSTLTIAYLIYLNLLNSSLASFMQQTIHEGYREGCTFQRHTISKPSGRIDIAWDHVMLQFACCGSEHVSDFEKNATHWSKTNRIRERLRARVPLMCCSLSPDSPARLESARFVDAEGCMDHTRSTATNLQVCYPSVRQHLTDCTKLIISLLLSHLMLEIFVTCLAAWFAYAIYKQRKSRRAEEEFVTASDTSSRQTPSIELTSPQGMECPVKTESFTTPS